MASIGVIDTVAVVAPGGTARLPGPTMICACGVESLSATSKVLAMSAAEKVFDCDGAGGLPPSIR